MGRVARLLGQELMPWQRRAVDIGLEYELDDDGTVVPAYREAIVTVMRQSGKSTLTFALIGHRCTLWPRQPRRVVYSAQDGQAAVTKMVEDMHPLFWGSEPFRQFLADDRGNRGLTRSNGKESVRFRSGSSVQKIGSGEDAGHGLTSTSLAIIDESFADVDQRREQALSPGMATVRDAQTWNVSTAGTDASTFLRRKIESGRAAAEAGETSGIAYIEYSIPDDADCDDPETWWSFMPALGWTIPEEVIRHERRSMKDGDWRRAYGNQWTSTDERAIPAVVWEAACSPTVKPSGLLTWVVEVAPDRDAACVVVMGDGAGELVEMRPGVSWVVPYIRSRAAQHGGVVRIDPGGPAGALQDDLERSEVKLELLSAREVVQACGVFYDGLADGRFRIRRDPRLDAAAASVLRRPVGDAWAWSRRSLATNVSPIMALSLACPLPEPVRRPMIHTLTKEAATT